MGEIPHELILDCVSEDRAIGLISQLHVNGFYRSPYIVFLNGNVRASRCAGDIFPLYPGGGYPTTNGVSMVPVGSVFRDDDQYCFALNLEDSNFPENERFRLRNIMQSV